MIKSLNKIVLQKQKEQLRPKHQIGDFHHLVFGRKREKQIIIQMEISQTCD